MVKNVETLVKMNTMDTIQSNSKETLPTSMGNVNIFNIQKLEEQGFGKISKLPYSHRVLLENIRHKCFEH